MLNSVQKKRLAKESRKSADKFAEGRGPWVDNDSWCGCGIGHLMRAARLRALIGLDGIHIAAYLDDLVTPSLFTDATWQAMAGNPGALVFPFLALADALEAKAATPNTREGD